MAIGGNLPETLNQKQAAYYIGMSTGYLKQKRLDGEGPVYSRIGKRVIYQKKDLDTFLNDHKVVTTGR